MLRRSAFSLVEVLISLVLGLFIIGVIYAGFRVAAQTVTVSERQAIENKLLVAGFTMVLDDVDSWGSLDRTDHTPLRTNPAGFKTIAAWEARADSSDFYRTDATDWDRLPQPFTAFADSWPRSRAGSDYAADWLAHDPRTWYRGDGAYSSAMLSTTRGTDTSAWGNYALFSCTMDGIRIGGANDTTVAAVGSTWLPRQQRGLAYGLGWYGWLAYLPANAFVDYYAGDDSVKRGGKPIELWSLKDTPGGRSTVLETDLHGRFVKPSGTGSWLLLSNGRRAATRGWFLYGTHVGISAAGPALPGETDYALRQRSAAAINRSHLGSYGVRGENTSTFPVLLASLKQQSDIADPRPEHWPQVLIGVRRFMKWGTLSNLCHVRVVDPLTGLAQEIAFPTIGTTLRGARLSRDLDR